MNKLHLCLAMLGVVALAVTAPTTRADDEKVIIKERPAVTTIHHYVYYPDSEVYFVPETRVYWYREGGHWRSYQELPRGVVLGSKVEIDEDQPDPWTHHDVIVEKYGGKHHKVKTKEIIKDENGTTTRETIQQKDGDVKIKEKHDND